MRILQYITDIIAPRRCYSCKTEGYFFCPQCFEGIKKYSPYCYICKQASNNFCIHDACQPVSPMQQVIIYGKYSNSSLQKLIHDGKFYGRKEVFQDIGKQMALFFTQHHDVKNTSDYLIIPAPMYFLRRWKRGYNHSEILAKEISKNLKIPYRSDILKKRKHTKQQSHLNRGERLKNLKNAFMLHKKNTHYVEGKTIILIDDVISTGSTLGEIAGILKIHGAKNVIGFVIASD